MKPIQFNTEMVCAILEGRKTVTRRLVKPQPLWREPPVQQKGHPKYWANWDDEKFYKSPYILGDLLYVRETFSESANGYSYKADNPDSDGWGWRPSIYMPREAARIFLLVTDVRVERLQDMQPYEIAFEGFRRQKDFISLWDSTIKKADRSLYGWNANPWVWVIEFERISREEAENGLQRAD